MSPSLARQGPDAARHFLVLAWHAVCHVWLGSSGEQGWEWLRASTGAARQLLGATRQVPPLAVFTFLLNFSLLFAKNHIVALVPALIIKSTHNSTKGA